MENSPARYSTKQMAWDLLIAFAIVFILFRILFGISIINGPSMQKTLFDGDIVFFRRINYAPAYGDIVLANCDGLNELIVKRVIGLPGDVIEIDEATASVYRNGELLMEDYLGSPTTSKFDMDGPVVVKEDCVFVMGDNRENSCDSRSHLVGQIPCDHILGKSLATFAVGLERFAFFSKKA